MYRISHKLKLCTCNVPSENCNHWALFRIVKGKTEIIIGETLPPFEIDPATDALNVKNLLRQLNQGNVFDNGIVPKERDLLVLSFYFPGQFGGHLYYGFCYWRKQWRPKEYDSLMWTWHHDIIKEGIIQQAQ